MKTILTILMILLSVGAFSQTQTDTTSVGDQLIKFEKQHANGVMLTFAGSISMVVGVAVVTAPPIGILGGVMLLAGQVILLDSHRHLRTAGLLMNQNNIGTKVKLIE
jgi:hypothetical protein